MRKQTGQLSWATDALLEMYLAADNRGDHVWRVCQAFDKYPDEVQPQDCFPVPSFHAPGIIVPNAFTNRTEALRVSEHFCRPVRTRTETGTWGCWRWTNTKGIRTLQLCIPFSQGHIIEPSGGPSASEN